MPYDSRAQTDNRKTRGIVADDPLTDAEFAAFVGGVTIPVRRPSISPTWEPQGLIEHLTGLGDLLSRQIEEGEGQ